MIRIFCLPETVKRFFRLLSYAVQDLLLILAGAGAILAVWIYYFGGASFG